MLGMYEFPLLKATTEAPIAAMPLKHRTDANTIWVLKVEDNLQQADGTPNMCRHL